MSPIAKTNSAQLADHVNELFLKDPNPSEFELRSLDKQLEKLVKVHAEAAYQLMGAAAAMRQDEQQARSFHNAAIRLAPHDSLARINFAISLLRLGCFADAANKAAEAYSMAPNDPEHTSNALKYAFMACQLGRIGFRDGTHSFRRVVVRVGVREAVDLVLPTRMHKS